MPPLTPEQSQIALGRLTADARSELISILIRQRNDIERRISEAAQDSRFSRRKDFRESLYSGIQFEYGRLNSTLAGWTEALAAKAMIEAAKEAIEDMRVQGVPQSQRLLHKDLVRFSSKHLDNINKRVNPYTIRNRVAVNAHLGGMAAKDIRQLREAVVDVFREAAAVGMTARDRQLLMQSRVVSEGGKLTSWQFIDRSGKRWKKGNYFNMVNRTVAAESHREGYNDAIADSGLDLIMVVGPDSDHDQVCKRKPAGYVGRILSVSGTDKRFPSVQQAKDDGLWHPNCVHTSKVLVQGFKPSDNAIEAQADDAGPEIRKPKPRAKTKPKTASA